MVPWNHDGEGAERLDTASTRIETRAYQPTRRTDMDTSPTRTDGPSIFWAQLLLLAVTAAAWGGTLSGGFRFDDLPNLVHDPATSQAAVFWDRLAWGVRPLLRGSYFLDHALWGMRPFGFLLTQLILHGLCVLGVHRLARTRLGEEPAALAAGLCFALQPAHAEAVAYVSGRSALLSTALLVAGLLAHERARRGGRGWRAASIAAFVLACLARETALVFPLLLVLWEVTRPDAGGRPPELRRGRLPVLLATGATLLLLLSLRTYRDLFGFSWALRGPLDNLGLHLSALPGLLSLWLRPGALSPVHAAPAAGGLPIALGSALAAALLASALFLRRRAPVAALAAGWVLVALTPTHTIFSRLDILTERVLYLAWIGPCLLLGRLAGCAWAAPRWRRALLPTAAAVLGLAGWAAVNRVRVWTDEVRLWTDTVAKAPRSSLAWNNLGAARRDAGDLPGAARDFRHALALDPANRTARFNLMTMEFTTPAATLRGREP